MGYYYVKKRKGWLEDNEGDVVAQQLIIRLDLSSLTKGSVEKCPQKLEGGEHQPQPPLPHYIRFVAVQLAS